MENLDLAKDLHASVRSQPWRDRLNAKIDHWMAQPGLYRQSIANPLTRWFTRLRTRQIFDLMTGFVHSQVLLSCVKLDLFGMVQTAPATLEELAARTQVPAPVLQRLLLSAVALRLLEWRSHQRFGLGPLGVPLATYEGIRAMVEHNNLLYKDMAEPLEFFQDAWRGRMAAYWPYAHSDAPAQQQGVDLAQIDRYSALMAASQTFVIEDVLAAYAFGKHRCVMDVGCGKGRFIGELAQRQSHLKFQLFDLPMVLALTRQHHDTLGISSRASYHPGSFFDDVLPQGADLITLLRVAHDHPDAAVLKIMRNIYQALPSGGSLLLAEPMAQDVGEKPQADAYFHFYLLAMGAGRLRTPTELTQMLRSCGFDSVQRLPNAMPIHTRILLARKR